jgi:hypothetical protein
MKILSCAVIFIGSIMVLGDARAESHWIGLWHSLNKICHDGSDDADRACNQRAVLKQIMKDQGCKLKGEYWKCPQ